MGSAADDSELKDADEKEDVTASKDPFDKMMKNASDKASVIEQYVGATKTPFGRDFEKFAKIEEAKEKKTDLKKVANNKVEIETIVRFGKLGPFGRD